MIKNNVWIVIPAYNEGKNVLQVIKSAKKYSKNIILVDDGSKDETAMQGGKEKITVLRHIVNMGKGGALKTGCDYAVSKGADILVVLDADAQHDPSEIPDFLEKIKQGKDIIFGYRKFNKEMPFILKMGNKIINFVVKILYNIKLKDTQCGYRAFTKEVYKKIRWRSCDYSMESEMIANTGKYKLKYAELPIQTIYSDKYKGTTVLDGLKIVLNMFFWRLRWF